MSFYGVQQLGRRLVRRGAACFKKSGLDFASARVVKLNPCGESHDAPRTHAKSSRNTRASAFRK